MQNTNPSNDEQPQQVSDTQAANDVASNASGQHPEQITKGTDSIPADSATTVSPPVLDVVLEASLESFPASDPPAWAYGSL